MVHCVELLAYSYYYHYSYFQEWTYELPRWNVLREIMVPICGHYRSAVKVQSQEVKGTDKLSKVKLGKKYPRAERNT